MNHVKTIEVDMLGIVIYVRNVIYVIYEIYDMNGALTYSICMYVNMGVKRSVRTSGMQPTILNILHKYV